MCKNQSKRVSLGSVAVPVQFQGAGAGAGAGANKSITLHLINIPFQLSWKAGDGFGSDGCLG